MDTIFALATARGRAGVAIIRISGDDAACGCAELMDNLPESRGVRRLKDRDGKILDESLVLNFARNQSFTGEAVIELHVHGSEAIIAAVLSRLGGIRGFRPAEPGEFTRRALENGRMDLAQVEGLADLIEAETEQQRLQAMRVFEGRLGDLAEDWRKRLIRAAALVEATIDFVDEDVPVDVYPEVQEILSTLRGEMSEQVDGVAASERIRSGFEVALVGAPNVGKSTLLNHLAGRPAAITSEIAGTTRDVIEVRMDLGGFAVTLLDTAGVRATDDPIEKLGVDLTRARADAADLRIFLIEPGGDPVFQPRSNDIVVTTKSDLYDAGELGISAFTGVGIDVLIQSVTTKLAALSSSAGLAIRERHRIAITHAIEIIAEVDTLIQEEQHDLVAEELRRACRSVDMIVGRVDTEDLLDEIFSSFCIGK